MSVLSFILKPVENWEQAIACNMHSCIYRVMYVVEACKQAKNHTTSKAARGFKYFGHEMNEQWTYLFDEDGYSWAAHPVIGGRERKKTKKKEKVNVFHGKGRQTGAENIEHTETAIQTIFYLILINIGIDLLRRDFMVCKILSSLFLSFAPTLLVACVFVCVFCKIGWAMGDHWRSRGVNGGQTVLFYFSHTRFSLSLSRLYYEATTQRTDAWDAWDETRRDDTSE